MIPNSSGDRLKFSTDSERHGLLGRIIENWLTSVNERQYQLPFCQVLAADGETILYVSAHGPLEKGKDIITRTAAGEIHAYQLKAGANGTLAAGRGLPSPYYSPEEALRINYGLDLLNSEQFVGTSYCIAPLIDFLARRWRRQALAGLWFAITRMSFTTYMPASFSEWFRWKSSDGVQDSRLAGEPQSWEALRTRAETMTPDEVPPMLAKHPAFALWFILVYPHRFVPSIAKLVENAVWKSLT